MLGKQKILDKFNQKSTFTSKWPDPWGELDIYRP